MFVPTLNSSATEEMKSTTTRLENCIVAFYWIVIVRTTYSFKMYSQVTDVIVQLVHHANYTFCQCYLILVTYHKNKRALQKE